MSKSEVMEAQCEAVKSVDAIVAEGKSSSKKSWAELRAVVNVTRRVISEMCTTAVPSSITFRTLPDGRTRIYFLSTPSNGWETTLLYADVTHTDHANGCRLQWQPIIEANFQSVSNTNRLSREEQLLSERKRLAHFGITSYELHVPSGKLVFPAASSIYQCVDNTFMPGPLFPSELKMSASGAKLCPQICPWDSNLIAHTCSGDIHLSNNVTGSSIRLTHARKGNVSISEDPLTAGTPSYVMQEEFTRYIGYWWQPKSNDGVYRIVYEEVDETDVKIVCFPSSCTSAEDIDEFRFPQAGTCNAHSNLKLLQFRDASNLQEEDIEIFELKNNLHNLFPWMEYLVRVGWTPDGQKIWAQLLDRKQQRLELILIPLGCFSEPSKNNSMSSDLYSYSVNSTDNNHFAHPSDNIQVLYSECSPIWINIDDLLHFLPSDDPMEVKFIWASEETKFRHLYLVTSSLASGTSNGVEEPVERMSDVYLKPRILSKVTLTQGEWEVLGKKLWFDEAHSIVYFSGLREGPLEEHVYAVSLHRPLEIRLLTRPGYSYNNVYFNQDCSMMVVVYSSTKSPPVCQVFRISQTDWTVDSINLTPVGYLLEQSVTPMDCLKPEIHTLKISSGDTIYAMIFKPYNYEPGTKYPTILNIYGGPAVQLVSNSFKGMRHLRMHMLASQGYCVVVIDSRGSHHRGVVFESYLRRRMGTVELHDQVEVLKWLAETTDCIDMNRVALHGWSYGGYLSLMGLIQYPDIFKLVIAGAPVTSWNFYDTGYTERYMDLPQDNTQGYVNGSILTHVNKFPDEENRLLIIHGLIDENVHIFHTNQLINALVKNGKPYQLQVYPNERHSLRSLDASKHYETTLLSFLQNYL